MRTRWCVGLPPLGGEKALNDGIGHLVWGLGVRLGGWAAGLVLGTLAGWQLTSSEQHQFYLSLSLAYLSGRYIGGKRRGWAILLPRPILRLTRTKIWRRNTTNMYKTLPLRMASRCWGWVNEVPLPRPLRKPVLGLYVAAFGCDMSEAEVEDLSEYANLSELFNRKLKAGVRPVARNHLLVSPADGTVQGYGLIEDGMVEQVKGINYPLHDFLGPKVAKFLLSHENDPDRSGHQLDDRPLHFCTLYLAPGDYHAFHSPARWSTKQRLHFSGELLSVSGWIMERVADIMTLNERVLLAGEWEHGFFSYTAVGATNVGNIVIDKDRELRTNLKGKPMRRVSEKPLLTSCDKGERIGEFKLGSSVVLVFQAPRNFRFIPKPGSRIRYGEPLGDIVPESSPPA